MTVDELLATAPAAVGASDEMLVIDPDTRQINLPGVELVFGVESDAQAERKYFWCPRYVGNGLDLASCFIRVNYRNANGVIDAYLVDDVAVTADGEAITFSWALHRKVTLYKGQVQFVVCCNRPGGNGAPAAEWNTTVTTGIVLAGLEPDGAAVEAATSDAISGLLATVDAQVANVTAEGAAQVQVVQTASKTAETAAVAEIEAKGVNVRASIPDDYTALGAAVTAIERSMAPGIVCEVEGTAVAVSDASNQAMRGLRIFGRSTQNSAPTPDAPVEIVSVEKPVVTVGGGNLITPINTIAGDMSVPSERIYCGPNCEIIVTVTKTRVDGVNITNNRLYPCVLAEMGADGVEIPTYPESVSLPYGSGTYSVRFVTKPTTKSVRVNFTNNNSDPNLNTRISDTVVTVNDSVNEGEYVAPQTVSITHTLPGIPVTSGGNYTDSDGQQWISDEVDLERGVYVQRVATQTVELFEIPYGNDVRYNGSLKLTASTDFQGAVICDTLPFHPNASVGYRGIRVAVTSPTKVVAWYDDRVLTTATVAYILATPIEIPLSETEIAAYRALHTNKPNTTILNDSGAHMAVAYTADTKLYIDNLLKE